MPQQGTASAPGPGANQAQPESITLERAAIIRRIDALFRAMSGDFLLREQFVTDPVQVLWEYVHGSALATEKATYANQLLYAVMANPGLRQWYWNYAVQAQGHPPPTRSFRANFGRALAAAGADHVVYAL